MRRFRIILEREEPPIILVAPDNDIEKKFLKVYRPNAIIQPKTELELYKMYNDMVVPLIDYYVSVMGEPEFVLSNEVRAMLGHLVDYKLTNDGLKENLEKAYGHFRRLNLDAFKILCDEYDKYFSKCITRFYKYDLRNIDCKFLNDYYSHYFNARNAYLDAQKHESLGRNSNEVYERYFFALREYIALKNKYLEKKKILERKRLHSIIFKSISIVVSLLCSAITIVSLC